MNIPHEGYTHEILRAYKQGIEDGKIVNLDQEASQVAGMYWDAHRKGSHMVDYCRFMKRMYPGMMLREMLAWVPPSKKSVAAGPVMYEDDDIPF